MATRRDPSRGRNEATGLICLNVKLSYNCFCIFDKRGLDRPRSEFAPAFPMAGQLAPV